MTGVHYRISGTNKFNRKSNTLKFHATPINNVPRQFLFSPETIFSMSRDCFSGVYFNYFTKCNGYFIYVTHPLQRYD